MKKQLYFIFILATSSRVWSCEEANIYKEISELGKRLNSELDIFRENIKFLVGTPRTPEEINQSETSGSNICGDSKNDNGVSSKSNRRYLYLVNGLKSEKELIRQEVESLKLKINTFERNMLAQLTEAVSDIDETKNVIDDMRKRQSLLEQSMKSISEAASTDNLKMMIREEVKQVERNLKQYIDEEVSKTKNESQTLRLEFAEMEKRMNDMFSNSSARLLEVEAIKDCGLWTSFQGSCYFYFSSGISWEQARDQCLARDAYLVEIDSDTENEFIIQFIDTNIKNNAFGVWFGASDSDKEGLWKWDASGNLLQDGFAPWKSPEPNGGRRENCLHWYRIARKWNDVRCNTSNNFVCERKV